MREPFVKTGLGIRNATGSTKDPKNFLCVPLRNPLRPLRYLYAELTTRYRRWLRTATSRQPRPCRPYDEW